jgi:hypothetical protein
MSEGEETPVRVTVREVGPPAGLIEAETAELRALATRQALQLRAYRLSDEQRAADDEQRAAQRRALPAVAWLLTLVALACLMGQVWCLGRSPDVSDVVSGVALYCAAFAWGMTQEDRP